LGSAGAFGSTGATGAFGSTVVLVSTMRYDDARSWAVRSPGLASARVSVATR